MAGCEGPGKTAVFVDLKGEKFLRFGANDDEIFGAW